MALHVVLIPASHCCVHIHVCICECHALLPVLVLLLPQASLLPASTKALEDAEQECGPCIHICECHALLPVLVAAGISGASNN